MRLVNADAVRLKFQQIFDIYRETIDAVKCRPGAVENAIKLCTMYLDEQLTIEAEPVRHGRWLSYTGTHYTGKENEYGDPEYKEHVFFVCSNCRRKTVVRENFCPNCGADMREEGADNG